MKAVVFLGPTLPIAEARSHLEAEFLPPAAQGDIWRAALHGADVIGIIDGQFDHVPSVWHKEILWAMSQGIHVYGSASMGALRAAELHAFGMEGVGTVFESFRDGHLEDDDEVAVVHASAQEGYRPVSEAMVNIRHTLAAAEKSGVILASTRAELEEIAKRMFYPDRSYPAILRTAAEQRKLSVAELTSFSDWWKSHRIDQKRLDAVAMLKLMAARHSDSFAPKRVTFSFQQTMAWQRLVDTAWREGENGSDAPKQLLDQLWLRPEDCVPAYYEAILRHLLLQGVNLDEVNSDDLREAEDEFRESRGFSDGAEFTSWLERNGLSRARLSQLLAETVAMRRRVQSLTGYRARLWDLLRLAGLAEKFQLLQGDASPDEAAVSEDLAAEALAEWRIAHLHSRNDLLHSAFLELAHHNWDVFVQALVRSRKSKL
jgi:hypothetical protein